MSLDVLVPQFLHLWNRDKDNIYLKYCDSWANAYEMHSTGPEQKAVHSEEWFIFDLEADLILNP